jgi:hypothetical protein
MRFGGRVARDPAPAAAAAGAAGAAADPAAAAEPAATEVLTTEIIGSAESYRRVGEVFVSVLAALPSLTLLTSLIRAPGDAGLDEVRLVAGVVCAALAVLCGVTLTIRLRAPVTAGRTELAALDFRELVLTNQDSYEELLERIDEVGDAIADSRTTAAERKRHQAQLTALLATLRQAQLLVTAKKLRQRVLDRMTIGLALASLGFVTAAIAFLALAPKPEAAATAGTTVVQVELTSQGAKLLGCPRSFSALRVGGTDDAPQVVPLGVSCKAGQLIELVVAERTGTASKVAPAEPVGSTLPAAPTTT